MSYTEKRGHGYGGTIRRAKRVQARRSDWAKHIDSKLKAPKAKNVNQWLSAPNRFDLPNVDITKEKSPNLSFSRKIKQIPGVIYKMKKLDAATFIDVRPYKKRKKDVGCTCCVLEPQSTNFISALTKDTITTEIHIFTNFKPWILIMTHEVATDRFDAK